MKPFVVRGGESLQMLNEDEMAPIVGLSQMDDDGPRKDNGEGYP
jgi:hypothetical protein